MSAPDLMAAVVERLRATPAVVAALGEVAGGPRKIWADDLAQDQPDPPYLTYSEPGEDLSPESADGSGVVHYVGRGRFTLALIDVGKASARATMRLVISALDDAALAFDDGTLLELRAAGAKSHTVHAIAPASPAAYHRAVEFEYVVDRTS